MLNRIFLFGLASLLVLTLMSTACVPDLFVGSSTREVVGKVVLDGQPVENAKVVFIPMKATDASFQEKNLSYATTDAEGKFTLQQANGDLGAAAGMHRVILSKRTAADRSTGDGFQGVLTDLFSADGENSLRQAPDELFPIIYNRQSTLTFDVDASEEKVEANFDLSSVDPLLIEK